MGLTEVEKGAGGRGMGTLAKLQAGVLIAGLVVAASGCFWRDKESITKPARPVKIKTIALTMAANTNDNWPVPVELVRVEDASLVETLLNIKANAWFEEAGRSFRQAHPEAHFDSWEIVPGTFAGPFNVKARGKLAAVLFCGTRLPSPPLRFERSGKVLINVSDAGCTLSGGK